MFSLVETEYSMGCWPCTWRCLQCFRDINHSWELAHVCKSTRFRVSAQFLYVPISVCLVAQSCPTLCDPMDCSPPGSAVHGDSLGKKIGVGCHSLLQRIFPTQGSNPRLPHCRRIFYHLSHQGSLGSSVSLYKLRSWFEWGLWDGFKWSRNPINIYANFACGCTHSLCWEDTDISEVSQKGQWSKKE